MKTLTVLCLLCILVIGVYSQNTYKKKHLNRHVERLADQIESNLDMYGFHPMVNHLQTDLYTAIDISRKLVQNNRINKKKAVDKIVNAMEDGLEAVMDNVTARIWVQGFCKKRQFPFADDVFGTCTTQTCQPYLKLINKRVPNLCSVLLLQELADQIEFDYAMYGFHHMINDLQTNLYITIDILREFVKNTRMTKNKVAEKVVNSMEDGLEAVIDNGEIKTWVQGFCSKGKFPFADDVFGTCTKQTCKPYLSLINKRVPNLCSTLLPTN